MGVYTCTCSPSVGRGGNRKITGARHTSLATGSVKDLILRRVRERGIEQATWHLPPTSAPSSYLCTKSQACAAPYTYTYIYTPIHMCIDFTQLHEFHIHVHIHIHSHKRLRHIHTCICLIHSHICIQSQYTHTRLTQVYMPCIHVHIPHIYICDMPTGTHMYINHTHVTHLTFLHVYTPYAPVHILYTVVYAIHIHVYTTHMCIYTPTLSHMHKTLPGQYVV